MKNPIRFKSLAFWNGLDLNAHDVWNHDRVDAWAKEEKVKLVRKRIQNFEILRFKDETFQIETDWILCIFIEVKI